MKRVKGALLLLLFLVVLITISHLLITADTGEMLQQLEEIGALCDNGNFEQAKEKIDYLETFCEEKEHTMALFLKRDYVASVLVSCSTLRAYAEPGSEPDLHAELDRAKKQIEATEHLFSSVV
ncbi:MAG: DUF4363 family protein [Oscillospiraceae bacterium]|nr:DUF4363 family protein [Oscillospiraceae bacterium]